MGTTRPPAYELIFALVAIAAISLGYFSVARGGIPQPTSVLGYVLGITGFVLMLSTETLYSLRKHVPRFHLGPMRTWLQLHVFTGLVGPYLVLLHSGWKFHGLAGVLTLVVFVVVLSGLVGRDLYVAVPRNLDGALVEASELETRIDAISKQLQAWGIEDLGEPSLAAALALPRQGWLLVLGRPFLRWRLRWRCASWCITFTRTARNRPRSSASCCCSGSTCRSKCNPWSRPGTCWPRGTCSTCR